MWDKAAEIFVERRYRTPHHSSILGTPKKRAREEDEKMKRRRGKNKKGKRKRGKKERKQEGKSFFFVSLFHRREGSQKETPLAFSAPQRFDKNLDTSASTLSMIVPRKVVGDVC